MLKTLVLLSLLSLSFSLCAEDWLDQQWREIPKEMRLELPLKSIHIEEEVKTALDFREGVVSKNNFVTRKYWDLGERLRSCLDAPRLSNWYTYAFWASRSAGKVISGEKFRSLGALNKNLFRLAIKLKKIKPSTYQSFAFSWINTQVGIEQIQVGQYFLNLFCHNHNKEKPREKFSTFLKKISSDKLHFQYLKRAFYQYYLALFEKDEDLKIERITLGSIYQVISEQIRLDPVMSSVFPRKGDSGFFKDKEAALVSFVATLHASLEVRGGHLIKLTRDVPSLLVLEELRSIELGEYQKLNKSWRQSNYIEGRKMRGTACRDWGNLRCRLNHLMAMFRVNMANPLFISR